MPVLPRGLWHHSFGFTKLGAGRVEPNIAPPPLRARTGALDGLAFEFRRYLDDQVLGRSCLIAGARGSGKTTLIESAHREVWSQRNACRLIRVRLHGPSLLQPAPQRLESPQPGQSSSTGGGTAAPTTLADPDAQKQLKEHTVYKEVLKTVLINLYQTLAEEVANAYQERLSTRGEEAVEMAAQLRLTLDSAPSADALRFFWEKADAFPGGVLNRCDAPADQGLREIVALATASEAYRSCTGEYTRKTSDDDSAATKTDATAKIGGTGAELKQAVVSTTSGVGVGAAVVQYGGLDPLTGAMIGAATAIASLVTMTVSHTRSRETTAREAVTFLPDLTVGSLVHRTPLLLRRLRQAGIAPVFIVDELDKAETPAQLTDLVSFLKFITADEAFFCFLTDAAYLANITPFHLQRADDIKRTIFTNSWFVNYHPKDLHAFLADVIQPSGADSNDELIEMEADAEVLRYVLIHRSRLLPFELIRAIGDLRQADGRLNLPPDARRRDRAHRFHLMLQLALEVVLSTRFVKERIERDAAFGQTIYDALFYPSDCWYRDSRHIDVSGDEIVKGIERASKHPLVIADDDREFLRERVESMLNLVADPTRLVTAAKIAFEDHRLTTSTTVGEAAWTKVREAIPLQPPLLKRLGNSRYEWVYNRYGIPYEAADVNTITNSTALAEATGRLRHLQATMRTIRLRPTPQQVLESTTPAVDMLRRLAALRVTLS